MTKCLDLVGKNFNRLTVIKRVENNRFGQTQWLCECECGKKIIVKGYHLKNGNTRSCGCLQRETIGNISRKHGGAHNRLYIIWRNMKQRCNDIKNCSYKNYGERGMRVCEEWLDFENFRDWALENGYDFYAKRGECTLDRIDNNGNYCPENCQWVSMKEQGLNRRNNHNITINGKTHCIAEWARIFGIKREIIKDRILSGWDEVQAVTTPVRKYGIIKLT